METNQETESVIMAEKPAAAAPLTTQQAIIMNGLIIAAAIIIGSFIVAHGPFAGNSNPAKDSAQAAVAPDIKKVSVEDVPYIGRADAPVTIAYWSDFQCPYCKQFQTQTLPSIVRDYVATGKVKILFKDFAFLGNDSMDAAFFSRAVWDTYPEKYFEWHEAMFAAQDEENGGFGDAASIKKLTAKISGVDAEKVEAAIKANLETYQAYIDADRLEATQFGVGGTPSFILGKKLIPGMVDYATFKQAIDTELK